MMHLLPIEQSMFFTFLVKQHRSNPIEVRSSVIVRCALRISAITFDHRIENNASLPNRLNLETVQDVSEMFLGYLQTFRRQ